MTRFNPEAALTATRREFGEPSAGASAEGLHRPGRIDTTSDSLTDANPAQDAASLRPARNGTDRVSP